eukprot:COSAG02_NODE_127_length_34879_cov_12.705060_15_plen_48_part_00
MRLESALYNDLTVLAAQAPSEALAWDSKTVTGRIDDYSGTNQWALEG